MFCGVTGFNTLAHSLHASCDSSSLVREVGMYFPGHHRHGDSMLGFHLGLCRLAQVFWVLVNPTRLCPQLEPSNTMFATSTWLGAGRGVYRYLQAKLREKCSCHN